MHDTWEREREREREREDEREIGRERERESESERQRERETEREREGKRERERERGGRKRGGVMNASFDKTDLSTIQLLVSWIHYPCTAQYPIIFLPCILQCHLLKLTILSSLSSSHFQLNTYIFPQYILYPPWTFSPDWHLELDSTQYTAFTLQAIYHWSCI